MNRIFFAAVAVALAAVVCFQHSTRGTAAQRSTGTDAYAITNARIFTGTGPTIERGTVVFRDGLITAVGERAQVPADARTIDGSGLTVYPGLIDAGTSLGIPRPSPTPGAAQSPFAGLFGPPITPSAVSPNSTQPPGLQPEVAAADIVRPGGAEIESARSAGITAAQTAPRGNIFLGQSAVINLAGDTPQQMIVRSPVALFVGLTPLAGGQYPGSLMGVFSSVRQLLLDAQRYREAQQIYERNPRGLRRPGQDKSLEALLPVLARQVPVVMQADREREIDRALDLAQEFNLKMVILGGTEAHRLAPRLKTMDVPVLLSLNFPRRAAAASPDSDPEALRVLRDRVEAPKTAGRLASAGVRFAFQSGGMTTITDFLANASRAVENGLGRDDAVRAMTIRPAEILGVASQLGSVEVGKIANLTVARGDLLARERRITHVFIDGRPVDLRPAAAPGSGPATATGTWTVTVNLGADTGEQNITLNLQQQGERLTGSIQGALGSGQIGAGSLTGTDIRFTVPVTLPAPASQTTDAQFTGTVSGNTMSGSVQLVGRGAGTFTATRQGGGPAGTAPAGASRPQPGTTTPGTTPQTPTPPAEPAGASLAGSWSLEFNAGTRVIPATLTLRQEGTRLTGTLSSELGTSEITDGSVSGQTFRFSATVTIQQTFSITVEGTVTGDRMSGTAQTPNGDAPFNGARNP